MAKTDAQLKAILADINADNEGHTHRQMREARERLERIRVAFQALRDGKDHASSKLYRVLAAEFPAKGGDMTPEEYDNFAAEGANMGLDKNRPKKYQRAWKGGIDLMRKITVCSNCKTAACWQGEFYCDRYKTAGTLDMALHELMALDLENAHWWFRDPGTGEVNQVHLETFRHNYPDCASNPEAKHD